MTCTCHYQSPLGEILLAADDIGLTGLWFVEHQQHFGLGLPGDAAEGASPFLDEATRWLDVYFSGVKPDFTPQLHLTGTEFRNRVCEALLDIPYGKIVTYGDIARQIGDGRDAGRTSCRAVGGAVARNPISLIVPCHRVVGKDGGLTGYGGGLPRKQALLALERGAGPEVLAEAYRALTAL